MAIPQGGVVVALEVVGLWRQWRGGGFDDSGRGASPSLAWPSI